MLAVMRRLGMVLWLLRVVLPAVAAYQFGRLRRSMGRWMGIGNDRPAGSHRPEYDELLVALIVTARVSIAVSIVLMLLMVLVAVRLLLR